MKATEFAKLLRSKTADELDLVIKLVFGKFGADTFNDVTMDRINAVAEEKGVEAPAAYQNADGSMTREFSRFCVDHGVSLDWLICGEGPKWIDRSRPQAAQEA